MERALTDLRDRVRGEVVTPEDSGYDEARSVYNALIDRKPAAVLLADDVADVIAGVRLAAENGWQLAVRGGGHNVAGFGTCDGGLVIDLGRMGGVRVDPASRSARAEGGCTWGRLDHAAHAFGLATPGGTVSTTGIAGLTLGGGMGLLARRHGLSCDNLLGADVVTAEGDVLRCDGREHPDLFWALRGGGGNFGVVTSFEYRLHPVGTIIGGPIVFAIEEDVVSGYRDAIAEAPEALTALLAFTLAPPAPFVPEHWHGRPVCVVLTCWCGPHEHAGAALEPFRSLGPAIGTAVGPMPYPAINQLFDALLPAGLCHYWKGDFTRHLTDAAVAAHVQHAARVPCAESGVFLFPVDGAVHRVGLDETAFGWRDAAFSTVYAASYRDPVDTEANIAWVRACFEAQRPHALDGAYVNFVSEDDGGRARANYGRNYGRLAEVKATYDPGNLFHHNQNVAPAA